jgi:alkylated DNA repair dioxygenase AlkB
VGDLFGPDVGVPVGIELPGGELRFQSAFLSGPEADTAFAELLQQTHWHEKEVFVWGKWHKQPRLVAWHGDSDATYTYSGSTMVPAPWTPTLLAIRRHVEVACSSSFNSVLLNLYRSGEDRMGWHSDDEPELGSNPVIGSLSLGATRDFLFKHRTDKRLGIRRIALTHGSLLTMAGATQHNWAHAINKKSSAGRRINLTFRRVYTR